MLQQNVMVNKTTEQLLYFENGGMLMEIVV